MYLQIVITGSKTNNNNHKRQRKKNRAIFFKGNLISNFDIGLVILLPLNLGIFWKLNG